MPVIVEVVAAAAIAFLVGALLAYLIVIGRRSAADRRW